MVVFIRKNMTQYVKACVHRNSTVNCRAVNQEAILLSAQRHQNRTLGTTGRKLLGIECNVNGKTTIYVI